MKRIYLDYASLTPIDPRVMREMKKYSSPEYANPSSLYKEGVAAKKAMEEGRKTAADFLHAHADEVVFTSGGTEANNLAIEGVLKTAREKLGAKPHLIISAIEHSSIMETANMLEKHGVEVTRLAVDQNGIISADELKKAIKPNTALVSIMTVNNEIGTVQPIKEIAKIIRDFKRARGNAMSSDNDIAYMLYPLLHTDAAQAALYEDLNVEKLGVDLMTLDGSKVYGPRGIGCLFVKRGMPIEPIIYGGGQERGFRSGTENVSAIMGFAKALKLAGAEREKEVVRLLQLRKEFLDGLFRIRPDLTVNSGRSPHILNVSFPGIDNELFVLRLDAKGIAVSTKSSCLRDTEESYVLKAIGTDSKTTIRFSLGRFTRKSDILKALKVINSFREQ